MELHWYKNFWRINNIFDWTNGLSHLTATENNLYEFCGIGCVTYPETARSENFIECSWTIAAIDLPEVDKYKESIIKAANERCFPAAIIAAFISRETRGGVKYLRDDGWWQCHNNHFYNDRFLHFFGITHLPEGFYFNSIFA